MGKVRRRRIVYLTGTRAEYGLMRSTLLAIKAHPKLHLELIVTGTHLSHKYGLTIDEIRKDGFTLHEVPIPVVTDAASMAFSFGKAVDSFSKALQRLRPDIILIEADRYEALAGAIAAAILNIPVAHVSGGDVSGSLDDAMRHSITKFAHLHFPGTRKSEERLLRMGEEPKRLFMVGTPGVERSGIALDRVAKRYRVDQSEPLLIVLQHPVTSEAGKAGAQMRETLKAVERSGHQAIIIYPNTDQGSEAMIRQIQAHESAMMRVYKNVPREEFLGLMELASVMIGNSSAGLTEAPLFGLPVINIGSRQKGRERGSNVHDVNPDAGEILAKIGCLLKEGKKRGRTPYRGSGTGQRIADVLANVKLSKAFLEKKMTY